MTMYVVQNYGPDGAYAAPDRAEYNSLIDAIEDVRDRLGVKRIASWRVWYPRQENDESRALIAYHESREAGCGGVEILEA